MAGEQSYPANVALGPMLYMLQAKVSALEARLDAISEEIPGDQYPPPGALEDSKPKYIEFRTPTGGLVRSGPYSPASGRYVVVDLTTNSVTQQAVGTARPNDAAIPQNELWIDLASDTIYLPRWG